MIQFFRHNNLKHILYEIINNCKSKFEINSLQHIFICLNKCSLFRPIVRWSMRRFAILNWIRLNLTVQTVFFFEKYLNENIEKNCSDG